MTNNGHVLGALRWKRWVNGDEKTGVEKPVGGWAVIAAGSSRGGLE